MVLPTTSDGDGERAFGADSTARPVDFRARALWLWPGVDRRRLGRTGGDLMRTARVVERRTALPVEEIVVMLRAPRHRTNVADHWYDPDAVTFGEVRLIGVMVDTTRAIAPPPRKVAATAGRQARRPAD
jgi:hypothetical protein